MRTRTGTCDERSIDGQPSDVWRWHVQSDNVFYKVMPDESAAKLQEGLKPNGERMRVSYASGEVSWSVLWWQSCMCQLCPLWFEANDSR